MDTDRNNLYITSYKMRGGEKMTYSKTTQQLISENYPYGFRLKTTKTDYLEFNKTKGFRHCSFTIDPRSGRVNKPKKGTYNQIMIMGKDEINHTKVIAMDFYDQKNADRIISFFSNQDNFELFTAEQIEYIYMRFLSYIKTSVQAQVAYCGSKLEDLKPLFDQPIQLTVKGIKEKGQTNYFSQINLDWEKINSFKVVGYQPFKMTSYGA